MNAFLNWPINVKEPWNAFIKCMREGKEKDQKEENAST